MKKLLLSAVMILLFAGTAMAAKYDVRFLDTLGNATFEDFVKEAGVVTAYRGLAPAEPQGITGFDVGVEVSAIDIQSSIWDQVVTSGDAPDYLAVPRLHVRKGLPFNLDVGAIYSEIPNSNIKLYGGEVQWALLEGTMATPALALRGSYSTLEGVDDLSLKTYAADAVISKGFAMLTPYAGVGVVQIEGKYDGSDPILQAELKDQDFTETRYFGGVQFALLLARVTVEAEYLENPVYSMKLSFGW
ncbi:hypothetical protein [Desulfuromonas sp. AOP6]|uniref:hypothetical protein n=1 Tax=Desulfuromonas sp. AOP6 TaxID=1566351 RepID=UPI00126FB4DE|nr:hypothetical protein [Desulfuromonas sp. AOP6]BCA78701.1 hypothetical protein AOP6_0488 [Desulfuromonas sp. AOP6]